MNGLRLVAAAATPALRQARFGGDHDLDTGGHAAARALRDTLRPTTGWVTSPSRAAQQTVTALGGTTGHTAPELADLNYGDWTGRHLTDLTPTEQHHWLTDPDYTPPHGESLTTARTRAGTWLDHHTGHTLTAVAHPTVIRAALAHALRLPPDGIWTLDIAPLATIRLTHRNRRWHLHL